MTLFVQPQRIDHRGALCREDIGVVRTIQECPKATFIDSSGLMEHFRDEGPFVREMYRILKPSGLMATLVPARWSL